jgi:hypothetical protein
MNKYKLLGFEAKGRGGSIISIGLILLAVAAVHQFSRPFLGQWAFPVWGLGGLLLLGGVVMNLLTQSQEAYVQIEEDKLVIQYGQDELPVAYENIDVVTGGRISQHHALKEFSRREREAVKPYYNQTHIFMTLHQETPAYLEAKKQLPRFVFGTTQPGLLLLVADDWLSVERAIDTARAVWLGNVKQSHQVDNRSLASQVLYDGYEEEDDE